ncbi:MAG: efflux RND transporter periplasmic adaptor subunit [Armatimonadota bacterium]|nr:efflux RND transporter periplasmic adaptor subunit [Armatimonadota bacterium]
MQIGCGKPTRRLALFLRKGRQPGSANSLRRRASSAQERLQSLRLGALYIAVATLLTLAACGRRGGAPAPQAQARETAAVSVAVAEIRTGTLVETASVTGELQSYNDVTVATKLGGRIVEVRVLEGDRVRKGEVIAIQDQTDLQLQLRQAEAAVRAAEANLQQAEIAARTQPAQTEAQIQAAKAALEAARARLRALQSGARPQERQQAEQAVAAARANFELAKANYERAQQLYQQGAIPKQQLDSAKTAFEAAQAQLRQAEETLSLVREGPRREEIEAAEQAVRQAEEAYRQALLGKAQNELARQRVDAARAALQQARAQVALLRQQLADTVIRAPFDGVVANRFAEVGTIAGAGTPVARIVTVDRLYFEATLPEVLLREVRIGMPVQVRVDAFPNRTFSGRVEAIYPVVADQARNLRLRISLTNPADLPLKAGLFARGEIRLREYKNVPLIPKLALIEKGGETRVFVVENGIAKQRRLRVVASNTEVVYAEGVRVGETVVIRGQDLLSDGQPVRVIEQ